MITVDFSQLQTKLVLEGLITQTVLPFDETSQKLKKNDICHISFEGLLFRNYNLKVSNVSVTSLKRLSNQDLFDEGFLYRPYFFEYMQSKGVNENDTVVKVDFKVIQNENVD